MTSRWIYLALAVIFAFGYIQETVARSIDGLELEGSVQGIPGFVAEPEDAGDKSRYKRSPKKHKKHGHVIVVHHHHGHHGHHGHHYHHG